VNRPPQPSNLRSLGAKLVLLVLAKIAVLTVIWLIAIHPYPRPDTRPEAVNAHLAPSPSLEKNQRP